MTEAAARTPRWVWGLILTLAALQPLVHVLSRYGAPEGTVSTGLHIPDSALFLYSLEMFPSGFHSHYATCQAAAGDASIGHYSVPHLWLYGALGLLLRWLPGDAFLYYGLANGLGMLFYLWVVYRFLWIAVPHHANRAFLLFALSGGPGGLLYLVTGLAGLHNHPAFDGLFLRFGVYDLMEGPHFNPVLYGPRLYYTLSLACCLGGLGAVLRVMNGAAVRVPWGWLVAVFAGSFLNARFGLFSLGVLALYVLCLRVRPLALQRGSLPATGAADLPATPDAMERKPESVIPANAGIQRRDHANLRISLDSRLRGNDAPGQQHTMPGIARAAIPESTAVFAGLLLSGALMRLNPAVIGNHQDAGAMAMWFSPFAIVTWLHWAGAAPAILGGFRQAARPVRLLLGAGLGYLAAYAVAYFLYQGYHGNLLTGRDGSVAAAISDLSLVGALAGAIGAWRAKPGDTPGDPVVSWLLLWLVGGTALALSGFGQGWFLRFGPQRLQVFLWLPLCVLAAQGLALWPARWRTGAYAILLGCGALSIGVAALAFQSPLGRADAKGPYPAFHTELMRANDAELMTALGDGTVLAPAPTGDILVKHRGNPTVFGIGSFNLTDRPYRTVRAAAETFFAADTPDEIRRAIAEDWCVAWVYCPATWPVDAETRAQLAAAPWLRVVAESGDGLVLEVRLD